MMRRAIGRTGTGPHAHGRRGARTWRVLAGALAGALAPALAGCAAAPPPETAMDRAETPAMAPSKEAPREAPARATQNAPVPGDRLPPTGFGTLEQDAITVVLAAGELQIKVVPLAEEVIRLTAPDTYRRLFRYRTSRERAIRAAARGGDDGGSPRVMLVTLFTRDVEAAFQPYDLLVVNQNEIFRPLDILPITPGFGRGRLRQQEAQLAMYLFSGEIDLDLPLTVRYQSASSDRWSSIRALLDSERARVRARAAAEGDE